MNRTRTLLITGFVALLALGLVLTRGDAQPNTVKQIAPGVWFREGDIQHQGHCNNIIIEMKDYLIVVDANFPSGARAALADAKKVSSKPVKYVFDTHHHGDHAYGNAVFAKAGASIVAQANCARLLRVDGPKEFEEAGKLPKGREDIRKSTLKVPNVIFDDKLVLDDGKQRVEFLFFGHAHTAGDACAYLPKHKILCTGDACVNGSYNFMGHSDSASWIRALEGMQQLDVKMVFPGHGPIAGKDLLEKQKRYFVELRQQVRKAIDAGKALDDIGPTLDMPWYKEWTTVDVKKNGKNIEHVHDELTGRIAPWDLAEDFGIYEGPSPVKDEHWEAPLRIVIPAGLTSRRLADLKLIAPKVEFVPARDADEAAKVAGDADAVVGFCSKEIVEAGKKLRWLQVVSAGVENCLFPELVKSKVVLTNTSRIYGPPVADQAFALLLSLTRGVEANRPIPGEAMWRKTTFQPRELHGKTMLIVGLGGIGTQIARRGHAFGMRVVAVDPREMEKPACVFGLHPPGKLMSLLPEADVVVLACPLTKQTKGMIGAEQIAAMKPSAYFINIARGGLVDTKALAEALKAKKLAGVGLDVSDPEPLPDDNALWKAPNVVITPHIGGQSPEAMERRWRLFRENVRRFVNGERLLCVVDKEKEY